jgi:hypothetical protein
VPSGLEVPNRWEAWLDEDGVAAGKPVNRATTFLARSFGWQCSLCGPVVVTGLDKNKAPAELPAGQASVILVKIKAQTGRAGN